jgi:hypothetical protein
MGSSHNPSNNSIGAEYIFAGQVRQMGLEMGKNSSQ